VRRALQSGIVCRVLDRRCRTSWHTVCCRAEEEDILTQPKSKLAVLAIVMSLFARPAHSDAPHDSFTRLKRLVGQWTGRFANGRTVAVSYALTAGDSVLVEKWSMGQGRESMTLYHMDGETLMATHYCPQGNQPRLRLVTGGDPGKLSFLFFDGTNLQAKDHSHEHAFWIRFAGEDSFIRGETYVENGAPTDRPVADDPAGTATFTRNP